MGEMWQNYFWLNVVQSSVSYQVAKLGITLQCNESNVDHPLRKLTAKTHCETHCTLLWKHCISPFIFLSGCNPANEILLQGCADKNAVRYYDVYALQRHYHTETCQRCGRVLTSRSQAQPISGIIVSSTHSTSTYQQCKAGISYRQYWSTSDRRKYQCVRLSGSGRNDPTLLRRWTSQTAHASTWHLQSWYSRGGGSRPCCRGRRHTSEVHVERRHWFLDSPRRTRNNPSTNHHMYWSCFCQQPSKLELDLDMEHERYPQDNQGKRSSC